MMSRSYHALTKREPQWIKSIK